MANLAWSLRGSVEIADDMSDQEVLDRVGRWLSGQQKPVAHVSQRTLAFATPVMGGWSQWRLMPGSVLLGYNKGKIYLSDTEGKRVLVFYFQSKLQLLLCCLFFMLIAFVSRNSGFTSFLFLVIFFGFFVMVGSSLVGVVVRLSIKRALNAGD